MKNKRADIGITILVVLVVLLCATALFSFKIVNDKQQTRGVDFVHYLRGFYNDADALKFSGENLKQRYESSSSMHTDEVSVDYVQASEEFIMTKKIKDDNGKNLLSIRYTFDK